MEKLVVHSPAKLNLTFEILGSMPDGFHEVRTLYQAVDLGDELTFEFERGTTGGITIALRGSPIESFPCDESNLITRAAELFFDEMDERPTARLKVTVDKRVPIAAGLAGGSGDAAATLIALNFIHNHPLNTHELMALAAKLGSDVPFCVQGGTCIGTGRGDKLKAIKMSERLSFLIVKPRDLTVSTPWLYKEFDAFRTTNAAVPSETQDTLRAAGALENGEVQAAASLFGNDFEPVLFKYYPLLATIRDALLELGSEACHVTGSGPAIYALCSTREMAHHLRREIREQVLDPMLDCYLADSVNHGAQVVLQEVHR